MSRRLVAHIRELLQEEEAYNGDDRDHDMGAPFHSAASVTWPFSEPNIIVVRQHELLQEEPLNGEDRGHGMDAPFHSAAPVTWPLSEPDSAIAT